MIKGTDSMLRWAKYSDLYEVVHPSLVLISLCLLTGAECGKGLLDRRKAKADGALLSAPSASPSLLPHTNQLCYI